MSRFDFIQTPLAGLKLVQRKTIEDSRGFLSRFYCSEEFEEIGVNITITQVNHTLTRKKGTIRGLHFQQPPHAEKKLITCVKGEVLDVAVDIRHGSPTFLQWHSEILSADNYKSLLIPEGYAHGFQTLTEDCELIYLHTARYHSESEGGLNVVDPKLGIVWPLPIEEISERDQEHLFIDESYQGLVL